MTNPIVFHSNRQTFVQTGVVPPWVYAISMIASAALLVTIYFINRRHSTHQIGTDQWHLRKTYLTGKERLWGLSDNEVYELLTLISAQAPEQSDKPFSLGVGKYIAYMPEEYRWTNLADGGLPKSLKPFQKQVIEASAAKIVVNLIYNQNRKEDYLYGLASEELSTETNGTYGVKYINSQAANAQTIKTYVQLADSAEGAFYNLAGYVAKTYSKDEPIFVHCVNGCAATAAFISWVEYMRRAERLRSISDPALLRQEMISILKEVAKTARGRVPFEYAMNKLLNPPKY